MKRWKELYYITAFENVPSILERGILSHAEVEREGIPYQAVYDRGVVSWRKQKSTPAGRTLWDYANLYFQPRNPMLYRLIKEGKQVVILSVDKSVMKIPGTFVTTGNAARNETLFLPREDWPKYSKEIIAGVDVKFWSEADGSKRRIMAEVLVPERIPPSYIKGIYVPDTRSRNELLRLIGSRRKVNIIPQPDMFFQPVRIYPLTSRLRLVEGDMFFSPRQTLTISVNTVGVMGKGLASRAKYQFPDAYVIYQDVCRKKILQPGRPYLYKRESSLDVELADDPRVLPEPNRRTWFLFFPTKRHWRERSRIEGIEAGLQWVEAHYREDGIQSLAMPALGCGLGGLEWAEVGPLMARYLHRLEIPVDIHLPLDKKLPAEQLRRDFLLDEA